MLLIGKSQSGSRGLLSLVIAAGSTAKGFKEGGIPSPAWLWETVTSGLSSRAMT